MRRSSRLAAVAHRIGPDAATFASLPLTLAQHVFLALPPDARGRACCVCRAWRDALAEPALWTRLDMSDVSASEGNVHVQWRRCLTVLHGAAARAHGQLSEVDLSAKERLHWDELLPVLTAYAGSLRELHLFRVLRQTYEYGFPGVEAVMAAAPLLQVLAVKDTRCTWEDAPRVLRAEPPFGLLQLRHSLEVCFGRANELGQMERLGPFAATLADAALQPALAQLHISFADTAQPALMNALVDAVVARRLRKLKLEHCTPPPAALLARLLAEGSLQALDIRDLDGDTPLFDAAGAALVADALRVNTMLKKLVLWGAHLCVSTRAAELLLGALVGHTSLRELQIVSEETIAEDRVALGAALAALIAADAPSLLALTCASIQLRDAGLAPIVDALALNRHLRKLNVWGNAMSEAFAHERLLPAVRANTTLWELRCADSRSTGPAAAEADEMVRRRGQHD